MPRKENYHRLYHMWDAAREAVGYTTGRTRDDLDTDRPLQHSLVRMLEIIGEAAGKVSPDFRAAHPEIPWSMIVGMRNRMIHANPVQNNCTSHAQLERGFRLQG